MSTGVGALGLVALVGAAIGLGAAFALVGAGAMMMGKGISSSAEGFSVMVPHILSLISHIPALGLLALSLTGIGTGLALIATAGTAALPALLALGTLGMVAGGLFGGGNNEEGADPMAGVEKKLDKLISLVESGGDVYIDGSKVGKSMQLSTSRMG